ncbi:MAG: disulfide bond formation protein B [Gammaproteobacteria bacterium]|nr:MAG: disulfide bond formation protein B [Gammaproteobacteria bacterium]RLA52812.1 MAG: disulfide bond formation protein B [Gammaproteobacteria bacterium]
MPSPRIVNLFIFIVAAALIGVALFMQHVMGLEPCYLCIVQRVFIILTGFIALLAYLHNPARAGRRVYGGATALIALSGGAFSIRQLWLQSLPEDKVPACGPPAEYLFDAFPLMEALPILLRGDGNCAQVQWTLFNVSIPGYTLMAFSGLALLGLWQLMRVD